MWKAEAETFFDAESSDSVDALGNADGGRKRGTDRLNVRPTCSCCVGTRLLRMGGRHKLSCWQ